MMYYLDVDISGLRRGHVSFVDFEALEKDDLVLKGDQLDGISNNAFELSRRPYLPDPILPGVVFTLYAPASMALSSIGARHP
ncbi:hypothetical protein DSO57_1017185 [Entomophthora muscae]|uniref:Uncharacterized protein n=1 Tax=Entomophthora muscae TaxID=34485 RepID=A0ACC2TS85_9FUNG|nr:hypothetical protein DSO57_1017185 [Entomophthora muscae]